MDDVAFVRFYPIDTKSMIFNTVHTCIKVYGYYNVIH